MSNTLAEIQANPIPYLEQSVNANRKADVGNSLMQALLGGAAAGGGIAGLGGLLSTMRRSTKPRATLPLRSLTVPIPINRIRREEEDDGVKVAADGMFSKLLDSIGISKPTVESAKLPLMGAGLAGGLYGGYKATDSVLDSIRQRRLQKQVDDAENEYDRLLLLQYGKEPQQKEPGPIAKAGRLFKLALDENAETQSELGRSLDQLYDEIHGAATIAHEKTAGLTDNAIGTMALYSLLTGVPAAMVGYQTGKKLAPGANLEKAKKAWLSKRRRAIQPEIFAVAKPPMEEDDTEF